MGARGRLAAGAQHEHRVAVQDHLVRAGRAPSPTMPRWQTTGGIAGIVRSTIGASAGSRRGSIAHDDVVGVDDAAVGADADDPAAGELEVEGRSGEQHGHAARLQARGQRVGQRAHPAGNRPDAEVLLDVGPHAHPGGHVAQVVALERHRVAPRPVAQPLVLERLLGELVQRQPGGEQGPGVLARVLGGEGALEPVAAQGLPVVGERVDVRRPAARPARPPRPRRSPRSGRRGCHRAGRARCRPRRRAGATGSTGTSSTSFSRARPDLRKRSRSTAGSSVCVGPESQRNPSCST